MSLLKTIKAQLGLSVTPANNFCLDASADNGTMKLARGNAGATTQDVVTVDAAGKVTFPQGVTGLQAVASVGFDGSPVGTGALTLSFANGVSSVEKTATGSYRVNFSPALPDSNYSVAISLNNAGPGYIAMTGAAGTSALNFNTYNLTPALADNSAITVTVFRKVT